jgi:predicted HTH domain antitoxin
MSNEISIAEAARVADVSTQTIRNLIKKGWLYPLQKRTHGTRGRTSIIAVDLDELREIMKRRGWDR